MTKKKLNKTGKDLVVGWVKALKSFRNEKDEREKIEGCCDYCGQEIIPGDGVYYDVYNESFCSDECAIDSEKKAV